jgi:hypothetical protein
MSYGQFLVTQLGQALQNVISLVGNSNSNVTLGTGSGSSSMTGTNNITLGTNSCTSLTGGSKNVAVGINNLSKVNLGNANTALGFGAGEYAASQCTACSFLGYDATPSNSDTTAYTYLTLIGAQAAPVIEGLSSQLVLGAGGTAILCAPTSQLGIPYTSLTSLDDLPTSTSTPPGSFLFVQTIVNGDTANQLMINTNLTVGDAPVWYGVSLSPAT